jgi:hypothetical protein
MKKSYRIAQETIYTQALATVKVKVKKVTAHRDGSATIPSNEKVNAAVKSLPGVEVLAEGKTEITFRIPAAVEYHLQNPPLLTEAERQQQEAERAAKREARAAKRTAEQGVELVEEDEDDENAE